MKIINGSPMVEKNVGKMISFRTSNCEGKNFTMTAEIIRVSTITNSQGTESLYVIELPLAWKTVKKRVEINLRDRSKMQYKLLIGRNWLSNDFLVDVDMNAEKKGEKE